jgi:hypothetical protein
MDVDGGDVYIDIYNEFEKDTTRSKKKDKDGKLLSTEEEQKNNIK